MTTGSPDRLRTAREPFPVDPKAATSGAFRSLCTACTPLMTTIFFP
jgi:hypothetical protein